MRTLQWTRRASSDLSDIVEYIARNDENAAREFLNFVKTTAERLAERPIGRAGELPGTYEKVLTKYPSYLLIYTADDFFLSIIRVFHTARQSKI